MTTKIDLRTWQQKAITNLSQSETPFLEAQLIAAHILHSSREWVIAHPDYLLSQDELELLNSSIQRLSEGQPLSYITGKRSFYGMDFVVSPAVLVPRPETELLVEAAADWLDANPSKRKAADIGTGSGIIAITLADRYEDLSVTALDISPEALAIAQTNASSHHLLDRIHFLQSDLLNDFSGPVNLILANLPYIPSEKLAHLAVSQYEPKLALDGGKDGLVLIRRLLDQAPAKMLPRGAIFLEIESTQGDAVLTLAGQRFADAKIELINDYANLPRLVTIKF